LTRIPGLESENDMSDPISNYGRMTQSNAAARSAIEKVDPKGTSAASTKEESAPAKAAPGADKISLSNVAQKVMAQPEFDRAKVESIKQAIKDGNYPVNPRRIAESFVALEKLITN
jgi:negative regulator of flagellin synthesis FlgM